MSRRIAFWVLAASAALIATPAVGDRECFEQPCLMPSAFEPPADASAAPAVSATVVVPPMADPTPPAAEEVRAQAHSTARPQMVVDPAPLRPVPQQPRIDDTARVEDARAQTEQVKLAPPVSAAPTPLPPRHDTARAQTEPVRLAPLAPPAAPTPLPPRFEEAARAEMERAKLAPRPKPVAPTAVAPSRPAQVRVIERGPPKAPAAVEPPLRPAQVRVIERGPSEAPAAVAPGAVHHQQVVVSVQPHHHPDPAWKRCQIDRRERSARHDQCGPYSYHPYGAHGYRPYGVYRGYRMAPAYVLAPDARIITIETDD